LIGRKPYRMAYGALATCHRASGPTVEIRAGLIDRTPDRHRSGPALGGGETRCLGARILERRSGADDRQPPARRTVVPRSVEPMAETLVIRADQIIGVGHLAESGRTRSLTLMRCGRLRYAVVEWSAATSRQMAAAIPVRSQ